MTRPQINFSSKVFSELVRTGWKNTFKITSPQIKRKLGLSRKFDYRIQKLGKNKVMKWSECTRPAEALAMESVRRNTSIPIPQVYDILKDKKNTYIVMEYIEGKMLAEVWTSLTTEQKDSIVNQLKGYLVELRALAPPYPGRVQYVDCTEIGRAHV